LGSATVAKLFRFGLGPLVSFLVGSVVLDPLVHLHNPLMAFVIEFPFLRMRERVFPQFQGQRASASYWR
jgi:hypothetical protein